MEPGETDGRSNDAPRRTVLAAERTWLAWWRTGVAVAATAIGVGGLVPQLVGGNHKYYVALGVGYAALAVVVFLGAGKRFRQMEDAIASGEAIRPDRGWIAGLTAAGMVLAVCTLAVIAIQP